MPLSDPNATGPVLHRIIQASLAEHGQLLTPDERTAAQRYLELPPITGHLYARLLHRVRDSFRDDALSDEERACLSTLEAAELIDSAVAPEDLLPLHRVPELSAACRALLLDHRGRRAALLERLEPHAHRLRLPAHRVRHRLLFQRLQRLFLRHPRADYRVVVLDALGVMPKPSYAPTPSASPFPSRAAMLQFEQARAVLDLCREGEPALPFLAPALGWLADSPAPTPGQRHFSTRRVAAVIVSLAARELERAGAAAQAAELYLHLLADGTVEPGALAPRAALATAAAHGPTQALALIQAWMPRVDPAATVALARTGRRLARKLRQPWQHPALAQPPRRELELTGAPTRSHRPLYRVQVGDLPADLPVEQAIVASIPDRRVLHGESAPWTTLFALLLHELYFLPIPGMLPVAWLSGPLDIGRPAFAEQRRAPLERLLTDIRDGAGPSLVRQRHQALAGQALAGARWQAASAKELEAIASALGGAALARILRRLAEEGWQASRGLPDLVILPGPRTPAPGPAAGVLPPGLLLAEVKGPGDQVRDAQAAWFHLLLEAQVTVELWRVRRVEPSHDAA